MAKYDMMQGNGCLVIVKGEEIMDTKRIEQKLKEAAWNKSQNGMDL